MLLEVKDLKVSFSSTEGVKEALCGVSFCVYEGEVYCLLGESGSGKTVLLKSVMGLLPPDAVFSGRIYLGHVDLTSLKKEEWLRYRGAKIGMVFQEPLTALNPTMKVGEQVAEVLRYHLGMGKREAYYRVVELFRRLGVPDPEERYHHYPHMFSGGMRQRVVIAMAIAAEPVLVLADEPTTALDVTVQAQILRLLRKAVEERGASMLFVTHDFSVAAEVGDRVGIIYRGHLVEEGKVEDVIGNPSHPYTEDLIRAIPVPGADIFSISFVEDGKEGACPYYYRCSSRMDVCAFSPPSWRDLGCGHRVRCHLY